MASDSPKCTIEENNACADENKRANDGQPASIHIMKHFVRKSIHLPPSAQSHNADRNHLSRSQSIVSLILPTFGGERSSTTSEEVDGDKDDNILLLSRLRERFKNKRLETLYQRYQQRMRHVTLKAYLHIQMCLCLFYIIIHLSVNWMRDLTVIIPEVLGQLVIFVVVCFFSFLTYHENWYRRHSWLYCTISILISIVLVAVDLSLCFWFDGFIVHVSSTFYAILVIYNLLPLIWIWQSMVIGIVISVIHVLIWTIIVTPSNDSNDNNSIMADTMFFLSANIVGIFTKSLQEITLRRTFLDRRKCIDTNIRYDYEKSQEEKLMMSILPKHIASEVREDIREEIHQIFNHKSTITKKPFDKLYVEKYSDVTILFADIVNFTSLTEILPSGTLVVMLNELFDRFDEAAKVNNCLRIKILGDSYNCVCGMPEPNNEHAKYCIEMGLKMIEIIKQVREEFEIDVDMRIGVHSGSVISGLLGLRKWQFDIWSRDVTIANHIEQSGIPGRVHVSMTTKALLGDSFHFEPGGGGRRDSLLAKFEIDTFLIVLPMDHYDEIPIDSNNDEAEDSRNITFRDSLIASRQLRMLIVPPLSDDSSQRPTSSIDSETSTLPIAESPTITITKTEINNDDEQNNLSSWSDGNSSEKRNSEGFHFGKDLSKRRSAVTGGHFRRRAVLMDSSLITFRQMMDQADSKMEHAIETMHLNKFRQAPKPEQQQWKINFLLYFSRWDWELPFLTRKDPLFNLYILGAIPVLLCVAAIQLYLYIHLHYFWTVFGVSLGLVVLVVLYLWLPVIRCWIKKCNNREHDEEAVVVGSSMMNQELRNKYPFRLKSLRELLAVRIFVFLVVAISVGSISVIDLDMVIRSNSNDDNDTLLIKSVSSDLCQDDDPRIFLWYFTYSCALTMTVIFGFYRIHYLIKFASYVTAVAVYSIKITEHYSSICTLFDSLELCLTCQFSPSLDPEIVHILYLFSILVILHVTDRQIEFIHRLDYVWNRHLVKEREETNTIRTVNKLLLLNVLPLHVAEVYLDISRSSDELYHEDYQCVAVMFASIPNFMDQYYEKYGDFDYGFHSLGILNQIISEFDALTFEEPFTRIEKIKLIGTTYMAACGLASNRSRKSSTSNSTITESITNLIGENSGAEEFGGSGSPLSIMVRFSAAMTTILGKFNKKISQDFQLRTGIDYGPVIAGVVGAQKPFYDIWGDTVNVASRLENTSKLGKIQVTERTARLVESEGIPCELRGETYLKGKGLVVTHWVHSTQYELPADHSNMKDFPSLSSLFPPFLRSTSGFSSMKIQLHRPPVVITEEDEIEFETFSRSDPISVYLDTKFDGHNCGKESGETQ